MTEYEHVVTQDRIDIYLATKDIFSGLIREVRELSKKKPDATMSAGKVKIVNRVLTDLKSILENDPEGKFLDLLDDASLPQTSDAVLVMVQYETALNAFRVRYFRTVEWEYGEKSREWITQDVVDEHNRVQEERRERFRSHEDDSDE